MKGIKHVTVSNADIVFNLTIDRNVSVICGNSGAGKTTLINMGLRWMLAQNTKHGKGTGVKVSADCNVIFLAEDSDWKRLLKDSVDTLFILDEGCDYISEPDFRDLIYSTGNYLVVVSRSATILKGYTFSINSIYILETVSRDTLVTVQNRERYVNSDEPIRPDIILTEDSKAGKEIYEELRIADRVESSFGRSSMLNTLRKLDDSISSIYLVVDGAAFGADLFSITPYLSERVKLFAPESFEYLLLSCSSFSRYKDIANILERPADYVDFPKYISYEGFFYDKLSFFTRDKYGFDYSKKQLNKFFTSESFLKDYRKLLKDIV